MEYGYDNDYLNKLIEDQSNIIVEIYEFVDENTDLFKGIDLNG